MAEDNATNKGLSIRYIRIKGNDRTRAYVIERKLQKAYQAKTLGTVIASLEEAMFGLQQLNIFEEIHFEMDDVEESDQTVPDLLFDGLSDDTTLVDINITVREKRVFGAKVMVESDGQSTAESTATISLKNLLGSGEMGQVSAGTDTNLSSILQCNVTWPSFYNLPCSMKIFGSSVTNQHWKTSGYNENLHSMGLSFLQHGIDGLSLSFQNDQRDILPTTLLKSSGNIAATKAISDDCQPTTKSSVKLSYTKDTRGEGVNGGGNRFVPLGRSYLVDTSLEMAGLANAGDVQFTKFRGLFQYWTPLFRKAPNATHSWIPMLTVGFSGGVVVPLPSGIGGSADNASKNRVRINDRIFLNNELMLRGFERRGIGPRAESITSKPEEVLHRNSKQPPVEAGYALGGNGQFLASARLEFPFPIPALHYAGCRIHLFGNCGNSLPIQEMYKVSSWKKSMRSTAGAGFVFGFPICRLEINYVLWSKKFKGDQCCDTNKWKWGISATFL